MDIKDVVTRLQELQRTLEQALVAFTEDTDVVVSVHVEPDLVDVSTLGNPDQQMLTGYTAKHKVIKLQR